MSFQLSLQQVARVFALRGASTQNKRLIDKALNQHSPSRDVDTDVGSLCSGSQLLVAIPTIGMNHGMYWSGRCWKGLTSCCIFNTLMVSSVYISGPVASLPRRGYLGGLPSLNRLESETGGPSPSQQNQQHMTVYNRIYQFPIGENSQIPSKIKVGDNRLMSLQN